MFTRGNKKKRLDLNRESSIKSRILDNLVECVKVVQVEKKNLDVPLVLDEPVSRLCTVLEALFIHGLKSTFLGRLPLWGMTGEFSPRLPEPSFWTFALLFSHKQVINTIENFKQINTEVGKARVWLRMAINDGLLVSYLESMVRDKSSLRVHYESHAMLYDSERMDLARSYITGLEMFSFNLPTNVSMLNRWLPEPLALAGLWDNSLQPLTDTACVDIAAELEEAQEKERLEQQQQEEQKEASTTMTTPCLIRSLAQPVQNNSLVQLGLLNEDEALRLILQGTPVSLPCSPVPINADTSNNAEKERPLSRGSDVDSQVISPDVSRNVRSPVNLSEDVYNPPSRPSSSTSSRAQSPLPHSIYPSHINEASRDLSTDKETAMEEVRNEEATEPDSDLPVQPEHDDSQQSRELKMDPEDAACNTSDQILRASQSPQCSSPATHTSAVTASMEWDEFHEETGQDHQEQEDTSFEVSPSKEMEIELDKEEVHDKKEDSVQSDSTGSSSDRSCTCSTQGLNTECTTCTAAAAAEVPRPRSRILLSEYVEGDPDSTDQISLEGERRRRRQLFKIGFRKQPDLSLPELSLQRNLDLVSCLDMIPRELGLHTQDWRCVECTKAIGALFGNGKVCTFTKKHYCEDCHVDQQAVIPPLLLYNWDNKLYPVSKSSYRFIQMARTQPIINLREFNPKIFQFVPQLEDMMAERKKLHYMHAYLTACKQAQEEDLLDKLVNLLTGREHLCTLTDLFSIQDVEDLCSGTMKSVLKSATDMCKKHIDSCLICSGRGFICEVCRDKKPVYPYNLEETSQCGDCFTVYHSECAKTLLQCPRCERISSRALNSLITEAKLSRELRDNL